MAMRVGAWSSTMRTRRRLFLSSPPEGSDMEGTTSGVIAGFPAGPDPAWSGAEQAYTSAPAAQPMPNLRPVRRRTLLQGRPGGKIRPQSHHVRARPPDAVPVKHLEGAEPGLVLHRVATRDPEAKVIIGNPQRRRRLDLAQGSERPKAARRLRRVVVEVDAAERLPAQVTDADSQETAGAVAVGELHRLDRGLVQKRLERL